LPRVAAAEGSVGVDEGQSRETDSCGYNV
jgi:hypothetical protein